MELSGEYTFDAPQPLVWQALQDPQVLGSVMPGGEGFAQVSENEFAGALKIKVGPVNGDFKGQIKLSNILPPESYTIDVDGKGAPGFVKATGNLKLTGQGNKTHMTYQGNAQIGGRIASVGQRLIDSSAKSIIRQSLEGLNEYLKVQAAAQPVSSVQLPVPTEQLPERNEEVEAKPAYKPPSQTEVAVAVAKDVANDLIPAQYRPFLIGAGVVILLLILWVILT